jgi:hypothetical protein
MDCSPERESELSEFCAPSEREAPVGVCLVL